MHKKIDQVMKLKTESKFNVSMLRQGFNCTVKFDVYEIFKYILKTSENTLNRLRIVSKYEVKVNMKVKQKTNPGF